MSVDLHDTDLMESVNRFRNTAACVRLRKVPKCADDLTGRRFGRLTVLGYVGSYRTLPTSHTCALWECRCDCGNLTKVPSTSLKQGTTRSCGCLRRDWLKERKHHGGERHAEG